MHPNPFSYTLNVGGHLWTLDHPVVMGILNVTPDSFYSESRTPASQPEEIRCRVRQILSEGAEIIDVGAYSTRPGAADVSESEEMHRLEIALSVVRDEAPDALVSVDTFRAEVARHCVVDFGINFINDISGGELDRTMLKTVARLGTPYILMHMRGTPETMQEHPCYEDVTAEVIEYLARRVQQFRDYGGHDVIVDPGFGFGKTVEHNYELMAHLEDFQELKLPLLVGISRKSMIYRLLGRTADEALNGSTVLHTIALLKGAHILRVHDVRAAVEACRIVEAVRRNETVSL